VREAQSERGTKVGEAQSERRTKAEKKSDITLDAIGWLDSGMDLEGVASTSSCQLETRQRQG